MRFLSYLSLTLCCLLTQNAAAKKTRTQRPIKADTLLVAPQSSSKKATNVRHDIDTLGYALEAGFIGYEFLNPVVRKRLHTELQNWRRSVDPEKDFSVRLQAILDILPGGAYLASEEPIRKQPSFQPVRVEFKSVSGVEVPLLRLPHFPGELADDFERLEKIFKSLTHAEALIVDLRGIYSEKIEEVQRFAELLTGQTSRELIEHEWLKDTKEAYALRRNEVDWQLAQAPKNPKDESQTALLWVQQTLELETMRDSLKKLYASSKPYLRTRRLPKLKTNGNKETEKEIPKRWTERPLIVLVDEKTEKAPECLTLLLQGLEHVRILGRKTAGNLYFDTYGRLTLPHTGQVVKLATKYRKFAIPGVRSDQGLTPDMVIDAQSEHDWHQKAMQQLVKEQKDPRAFPQNQSKS